MPKEEKKMVDKKSVKKGKSEVVEETIDVAPEGVEDDKLPLDPETGLDPEKLHEELEGLKDLVQGEIDKMMDENPDSDWKEIVQEAKEEKLAAKLHKNDKLCEVCEERPVGENGVYCDECLEGMKHYPFKWWQFIIPIIMVIFLFLAGLLFSFSYSVFSQTVEAQSLAKQGKLISALKEYDNINAEIRVTDDTFGYKYLANQAKIYETMGIEVYEDFNKFVDDFYTDTQLGYKRNAYTKKVKDDMDLYIELFDSFEKAMNSSDNYKDFIKNFEKDINLSDEVSATYKGFANYYKYIASLSFDSSSKVQKSNIDEIKKEAPELKSLYLPLYAEWAVNNAHYKEAIKYAGQIEEYNSESSLVALYKTIAYRMQGNLPKASNACLKGIDYSPSDPALNYQMAIISLCQGQMKTALHYAEVANSSANTQNMFVTSTSLYALCAGLNNDTETYNKLIKEAEEMQVPISKDVADIISGDQTIENVFMKGKGDLKW